MAKKSTKSNDLLDLLDDEKNCEIFMQRLAKTLMPYVDLMFEKKLEMFTDAMSLKIDKIVDEKLETFMDTMSTKIEKMVEHATKEQTDARCGQLEVRLTILEEQNKALTNRMEAMEVSENLPCLLIYGLKENTQAPLSQPNRSGTKGGENKEAVQATIDLCNRYLDLHISDRDLISAHRIPAKGKDNIKPLIVKFASTALRNDVYRARLNLRKNKAMNNERIYINEYLTANNARLYAKARECVREKRLVSTWTYGGRVFIRATDNPTEKPKRIYTSADLELPQVNQ